MPAVVPSWRAVRAVQGEAVEAAVVTVYVFSWGNTPERASLKGRRCRILARGAKGTVLVEFEDSGQRETVSFRALRRAV